MPLHRDVVVFACGQRLYVDDESVRFLEGLETDLDDGDVIAIIPRWRVDADNPPWGAALASVTPVASDGSYGICSTNGALKPGRLQHGPY